MSRFNKTVKFLSITELYDTKNSEVIHEILEDSEQRVSGYMLTSTEEMQLFGEITNSHFCFFLLGYYNKAFDYVEYEGDYYKLVSTQKFKSKQSFLLEKVNIKLNIK